VYTEKVLKTTSASLWLRNVQMGSAGALLSLVFGVMMMDRDVVMVHGVFWGYAHNPAAWFAVGLNAFGGLLTAGTFVLIRWI
jgi:UDP-sugar transporter A1/2/3